MTATKVLGAFFLVVAALAALAGVDELRSRTHEWASLTGYTAIAGALVAAVAGSLLLAMPRTKGRSGGGTARPERSLSGPLVSMGGSALGAASLYVAFSALVEGAIPGGRKVGLITFHQHPFGFTLRFAFVLIVGAVLLRLFLPGLLRIFRPERDE